MEEDFPEWEVARGRRAAWSWDQQDTRDSVPIQNRTVSVLRRGEVNTMKYCLNPREIPGMRQYFIIFPHSSHNTDILNYNSRIDLPGRSILEELIVRIAPTAGQYGKILPSRLSNTEELNFNIIMFSN